MSEDALAPEIVEQLRQRLLEEHPEMAGAELRVKPRRHTAGGAEALAKLGLPAMEQPAEELYTATLRKDVEAEDGATIPLVIRVTVDAQGRVVKRRERH